MANQSSPDLILLDISSPGVDGATVCRSLRACEDTADIPVVFVSTMDVNEDRNGVFEAGAVDYLTKPFQLAETTARVTTHLKVRRLARELKESNEKLEQKITERTAELSRMNDAYQRFVPRQFLEFLAKEHITDVRLADQVEHEMTVMFTDIRDFTPLSERMNPQENFNFLNSYLSRVSPVISQHGGFIDKYFGDGIMALFPDSPDQAVTAAVKLQEEVGVYNAHRGSVGYAPVRIGTSLHTGSLMLGIIGEEHRMEATVIADAVNLAARLESLTKMYGVDILASASTYHFVKQAGQYDARWVDEVRVKGRQDPVKLYQVIDRTLDERSTRLVDLTHAYEQALADYQAGALAEAKSGFESVTAGVPDDVAACLLLDRISYWEARGLPDDWEGIWSFNH